MLAHCTPHPAQVEEFRTIQLQGCHGCSSSYLPLSRCIRLQWQGFSLSVHFYTWLPAALIAKK
jgi:hypothetical protein